MRAHTNDIGVAVQARIVCNGDIMIFENVFDIYNISVSETDGRQKGNMVLHDVVLTFSARGVNLLDSAYTMDYVATAHLKGTEILKADFQCCDIVHMHARDGKKMVCRACISTSPLPVVAQHLRDHLQDGQPFYWKDVAEMRDVIQPFVNSIIDRLKADVGQLPPMNSTVKRARKADAPRQVEAGAPSVSPLSLNNLLENELPAEQSGSVSPTWSLFYDLQEPQGPVESPHGGSPTPSSLSSLHGMDETDGTIESSNSQQSSVASEEHIH